MKTLVIDELTPYFWQLVDKKGFRTHFLSASANYSEIEIVIIKTFTKVDRQFLNNFPNLKMIIRAGSGYDNIDLSAAAKREIYVCNTPEANVLPAVEQTISFIYALLKQHQTGKANILDRKWKDNHKLNWEIGDLKALIVGVGRIGSQVAAFLRERGAEVYGVDPYLTEEEWMQKKVEKIGYGEGLKCCNLITYHCPLTSETKDYFSKETLKLLSHPAWLINTARGGIVDQEALKEGLDKGMILGAGLDVYQTEPHPLLSFAGCNNVYLTPHTGAYTAKARQRIAQEIIKVWEAFVLQRTIINRVKDS